MKKLTSLFAVVLTVIASTVASSACIWFIYQPKEPQCLREK